LVVVALISAPKLGAALLMSCLVAGQLLSSVIFDHMGWLGYAPRPISPGRIAGVACLGVGIWLIKRF
jgi:transporter family-2 protein